MLNTECPIWSKTWVGLTLKITTVSVSLILVLQVGINLAELAEQLGNIKSLIQPNQGRRADVTHCAIYKLILDMFYLNLLQCIQSVPSGLRPGLD